MRRGERRGLLQNDVIWPDMRRHRNFSFEKRQADLAEDFQTGWGSVGLPCGVIRKERNSYGRVQDHEVETITKKEKALRTDGIDRRDFLNCMAWAGTGLLWTFIGGVPTSRLFADTPSPANAGSFSFFQISDSHIGFSKPANMDVTATLKAAIDKINVSQSKQQADLILHTGDVSHIEAGSV